MRQVEEHFLGDHKFVITKLTPEAGSYWAMRMLGELFSSGVVDLKGNFNQDGILDRISEFTKMPREQFKEFQADCMAAVSVQLDQGLMPLRDSTGHYIVPLDGPVLFELTLRSFMFTITDFFSRGVSAMDTTKKAPTDSEKASSTPPSSTAIGANASFGTVPTQPPIG